MIHVRWVERKISLKSRGKNRNFILGNITSDIVSPSCKVLWLNKNSHKEHWGERNYAHSKFRSFFLNIWSNSRSGLLGLEKFYKLLKSWSTYWIILFESFFFPPEKNNLQSKDVLVSIWKALYIISYPMWSRDQVHKACFSSFSCFLALQLFYTFWFYIHISTLKGNNIWSSSM